MDTKEPYRATKLWNEVIIAFQSGMSLRKHRRKMHTYQDCFMASDAVTWLHCYLMNNPNFGIDVTRQQTINLLGKFLKCRVIEIISHKSKKCEFFDNSHLYRFTQVSPQQLKVYPLRLVQSPLLSRSRMSSNKMKTQKPVVSINKNIQTFQKENIPECVFVQRKVPLTEVGLIWKNTTLSRLENVLLNVGLKDVLDEKSISGHVVKHNVCRISRTGVVNLIDKTDDIPHWIVSAMKCLANWPNASGSSSCLPNYPGFEKDVFKVVRDFFINPQVPLIPEYLTSALLTIFCQLLKSQLKPLCNLKCLVKTEENTSDNNQFCTPIESLTNVKTSTPVANIDVKRHLSKNTSFHETSDGKLLLDDPEIMWDYPSAVYYETDFANSDPVTKMVSSHSKTRTLSFDPLYRSSESISTISICSMKPDLNLNPSEHLIPTTSIKNWNSESCLQGEKKTLAYQSLQLQSSVSKVHDMRKSHSMFDYLYIPYADHDDQLNDSTSSSKTIIKEEEEKLLLHNLNDEKKTFDLPVTYIKNSNAILCERKSSLSICSYMLENNFGRNSLKEVKEFTFPTELKLSFQLILLFLHPPNRRQLHLLFRVINKILKNENFIFDVNLPMRDYLLQTFLPAIVQSDMNQNVLFAMVSFLLDNCEVLFTPPSNLKEEVEEVYKMHTGKIVFSVDDACYLTYCELVSKQQYEQQKMAMSTEALKSLLSNIIQDKKLSEKEKKKRIKQFKEIHPNVYYELFPGKPNLRRSRSTFLNKLANLRM